MFQAHPPPPLPALGMASVTPATGTAVIMIGNGVNRGPATSFDPNGALPPHPVGGYQYGSGQTLRWGTNSVSRSPVVRPPDTKTAAIQTVFHHCGSAHES